MKILYVYSDWKWTGPAQSIVELCHFMSEKAEVFLLTSTSKNYQVGIISRIKSDKVNLIQELSKRGALDLFFKNRRLLKQIINHIKPDIIHLFRERDLTVLFNNSGNTTKVFTDFKASHPTLLRRIIWKKADVITVFSKKLQAAYQNKFKNIFYIDPWLDLQQIPKNPQNMRLKFGLSEDDFIVGLIMRVQSYRRFELVVEIAKLIKQSGKKIKFLLLGRGHLIQKLAAEPVKRNGLTDVIIFGGYRNQDYWNAIHCFNIMFYTVAGSDGTARALRQCQAMGKPVICLRSDFTQEIVHEGIDGFLVQDKPIEVLEKILKFYIDSNMLSDFSKRSEYQGEQYDIMKIGQEMYKLYENQMMGK